MYSCRKQITWGFLKVYPMQRYYQSYNNKITFLWQILVICLTSGSRFIINSRSWTESMLELQIYSLGFVSKNSEKLSNLESNLREMPQNIFCLSVEVHIFWSFWTQLSKWIVCAFNITNIPVITRNMCPCIIFWPYISVFRVVNYITFNRNIRFKIQTGFSGLK